MLCVAKRLQIEAFYVSFAPNVPGGCRSNCNQIRRYPVTSLVAIAVLATCSPIHRQKRGSHTRSAYLSHLR